MSGIDKRPDEGATMMIIPDRLYTTAEVAELIDVHLKTAYAIPEKLLRRTRVGPKLGKVRVRGRDLLAYLGEQVAA